MKRRDFLKIVGTTTGGTLFLPRFLAATPVDSAVQMANNFALGDRQILVMLQLNGGNDGLNTFIPFDDPAYFAARPNVAIPKAEVLKAVQNMGFHPALSGFAQIFQDGNMSILQNVGYPNPNRSHFRSIEIWQTGSSANEYSSTGWLGRFLDANCKGDDPLGAMNLDNTDNLALRGQSPHALTMQNPQQFERQLRNATNPDDDHAQNPNLSYVQKLMIGAFEGHDEIKKALNLTKNQAVTYPKFGLAQNLQWIARMAKGNLPTSVFYTSLGSFDTHANQLNTHKNKLKELGDSVKAFYDDLKTAGLLSNVTLVVFSEFGRRVKDNGSGTDHGTAAPVFVIGGKNQGKIIGKNPNLLDLDNGDLKHKIDFRNLYSTILNKKFGIESQNIQVKGSVLDNLFV